MKQKFILFLAGLVIAAENLFSTEPVLDLANQGDGALGAETGRFTLFAEATIATRYLLVKKGSGDNEFTTNGATDRPIGVCEDEPAAGDPASIHGFGLGGGSMTVVASKAIAVGDECFTAAGGKVSDAAAGYSVGFALTAAAADGERLQIAPNLKLDSE